MRILFVVNVDWFFLSHRLELALAARRAGFDVAVAAADTGSGDEIRSRGLEFIPLPLSRRSRDLRAEVRAVSALVRIYRRLQPDLIHHVTAKPIFYGSLASRFVKSAAVVNAISGLGYAFSDEARAPGLRNAMKLGYRYALARPRSRTIFQNPDDRDLFIREGLIDPDRAVIIRGAGVDCNAFAMAPEEPGPQMVMLPARMLWDKGVGTFVEAARRVKKVRPEVRFVLVGGADEHNPAGISPVQLNEWAAEGAIEWWDHQADMTSVLPRATVVVLPSAREGLPKVLLEAAACGKPLVTTDVPGCREVVVDGVNGALVPFDSPDALSAAVLRLLDDPGLRKAYGQQSRQMAETEFSQESVNAATIEVYRELLMERPAASVELLGGTERGVSRCAGSDPVLGEDGRRL